MAGETDIRTPKVERQRKHRVAVSKTTPAPERTEKIEVEGIVLSHPDRVLYPDQGRTKRELAEYYVAVADTILAHVGGRPLSLVRCPAGRQHGCFFQKHVGDAIPEALGRCQVREEGGQLAIYPVVEDVRGLIMLVQMGVLEIHAWTARASSLDRPDHIVFDLDPGPGVPFERVVHAARVFRERLIQHELESWPMLTGGKGLHVVIPIEPRYGWRDVLTHAQQLARACAEQAPGLVTIDPSKPARQGKIYLDYLRNWQGIASLAPYSTRARAGAPVATPLTWTELGKETKSDAHDIIEVPRRLAKKPDPWAKLLKSPQSLESEEERPDRAAGQR